jgi:hypothetical protein
LEEATMNTTTVHHRRPLLPALNMFLAVGAVVISVFAVVTDSADVTEVITQLPGANVSQDPAHNPATPAPRAELNPATMTPLLAGCSLAFGRC